MLTGGITFAVFDLSRVGAKGAPQSERPFGNTVDLPPTSALGVILL